MKCSRVMIRAAGAALCCTGRAAAVEAKYSADTIKEVGEFELLKRAEQEIPASGRSRKPRAVPDLVFAGAPGGNLFLPIFGLALSIPFIVFTSNVLQKPSAL